MGTYCCESPYFRQHAERVIRQIVSHFKDHPAVVGYQIDNETFPTNVPTQYTNAAFLERLKRKFGTPDKMNKAWGLVYWGQLVDRWEDLPPRDGILTPGYKLEWENFQHDIVTEYLAWQAKIVDEYKRTDQFVTTDFSGGVHTNLDQWAISRNLDIVSENVYFETARITPPWLSYPPVPPLGRLAPKQSPRYMVFSKVGPNQSIEWGQIRVSKSPVGIILN